MNPADINAMTATAEAILAAAEPPPVEIPRVGIVRDLPEDVYHSDPCADVSLSSSCATKLVHQCPALAYHYHPQLGGAKSEDSPAMTTGRLIHKLVLEKTTSAELVRASIGCRYEVVSFDSFRTKAAKEKRDRLALAGVKAITHAELDKHEAAITKLEHVAGQIREQLSHHGVRLNRLSMVPPEEGVETMREASLFWRPKATSGREIQCRGRTDVLTIDAIAADIVDLKTCRSAKPSECEKSVERYGYDIQAAAYTQALEHVRPELAGRVTYRWFFVQLEPIVLVTPGRMSGELRELGERRWQRAVDTWADCVATNTWPGYVRRGEVARIEALPWAAKRELGI